MTEIWYARLLRLYPADHPRDEMLDVLLTSGRPFRREVLPLVLGGLRARSGGGQSLAVRWRYAARAAALMLLIASAAGQMSDALSTGPPVTSWWIVTWSAAAFAFVAVLLGFRLPGFVLALTAFLTGAVNAGDWRSATGYALAATLLLIPGPRTPVVNPLLPVVALAAALAGRELPTELLYLVLVAVLLWSAVVDERILLAVGIALSVGAIQLLGYASAGTDPRIFLLAASRLLIPAILLTAGAFIAVRRARV
jgi:hypothetical protein